MFGKVLWDDGRSDLKKIISSLKFEPFQSVRVWQIAAYIQFSTKEIYRMTVIDSTFANITRERLQFGRINFDQRQKIFDEIRSHFLN